MPESMKISNESHLTYCSNIHAGESWKEVSDALKAHLPVVKEKVSPEQPMGVGLRLSNQASLELQKTGTRHFLDWMNQNGFYVFTMNGFPYGGFHRQKVKDQVHQPDWTTAARLEYTLRLFDQLAELLPEQLEGGISTSPLSYKYWWSADKIDGVFRQSTLHLIEVVKHLHNYHKKHGILLHLDLEPEPDGLIENSDETIAYYRDWLLPVGRKHLAEYLGVTENQAEEILLRHITVCYDVCHFAVAYESHTSAMERFSQFGIQIGKIQISSALKTKFTAGTRSRFEEAFKALDEPTYLHQVVARDHQGILRQYTDLPVALEHINDQEIAEWRTHFHVPVFVESFGLMESTQADIKQVLDLWSQQPMTRHLEVETYTWEVLPPELQTEMNTSIARELNWVVDQLST
ncbi:MAG: sugar phosphate isomerase [Cyclobacteriaceae bacterium]|nr:MAG: sugar phosphate isomerase [Cyclobacteriaceae bacterium]